MRIVIDLQGAQTESRFRGVGRYTLSIAKAMCREADGHEIILLIEDVALIQGVRKPVAARCRRPAARGLHRRP